MWLVKTGDRWIEEANEKALSTDNMALISQVCPSLFLYLHL